MNTPAEGKGSVEKKRPTRYKFGNDFGRRSCQDIDHEIWNMSEPAPLRNGMMRLGGLRVKEGNAK